MKPLFSISQMCTRRFLTVRIFTVMAFALSISPAFSLSADKKRSDDWIYDQVRIQLTGDMDLKGAAIEVEVKDSVVWLKGTVKSDRGRQKAEKRAKKVDGVKKVNNELRVVKTP